MSSMSLISVMQIDVEELGKRLDVLLSVSQREPDLHFPVKVSVPLRINLRSHEWFLLSNFQ